MAARKFKFVSPGVFLKEIDQSQLPRLPGNIGPVVIGRTRKGPALRPTQVQSYQEFVEMFGTPMPGNQGDDPWRDGNGLLAPAYAHYAAKAHFSAGTDSPLTMVRLLGVAGDNAGASGEAGWTAEDAFGLFTFTSASSSHQKAKLSAVLYSKSSTLTVGVSGSQLSGTINSGAVGGLGKIVSTSSAGKFMLQIQSGSGTLRKVEIDFTKGSKNFIRDVLNTNPVMTNSAIATANGSTNEGLYWLGETFESTIDPAPTHAFVVKLSTQTVSNWKDFAHDASAAQSGWLVSQAEGDKASFNILSEDKLFRLIALSEGEEFSKNYVIAIEDIRIPQEGDVDPYGSFTVIVKQVFGTKLEVVESFTGCNLNPNSQNYVARQIGDQFIKWSSKEKRNKVYGNYPNRSRYVRVEMKQNVEAGLVSPSKVPFGFLGPVVPADVALSAIVAGGASGSATGFISNTAVVSASADTTGSITASWAALPTTISASVGGSDYFGAAIYKLSNNSLSSELDRGLIDYVRKMPSGLTGDQDAGTAGNNTKHAFLFSLNDVVVSGSNLDSTSEANVFEVYWKSGSHKGGTSLAALSGTQALLNLGFNKFHLPLVGGFDGVDVTEADPFNNTRALAGGTSDKYAYASVDRAIELIRDPESVEFNLACMPGITSTSLTTKLVQTCEARADAMAIIDLPDVYKPAHEVKCDNGLEDRLGTDPTKAAQDLKKRALNSSYGATYYPWVKISDTENTRELWAPPSIVALGVMAYTEKRDEVWFAPAGFNRGGLNEGNAGIPVLQTSEQLLSKQRDTLYEANINPIASFVTEGLVVFGQKTLQMTPSALDRINVRRLLIFVKKEVSRIANGLLFDQNVPATWNRFLGQVNPFLQSVKTKLGLSDFKVILDNTTTTPDLVDRNVMYAKIFLKPARAIEFIAVDFVITNTGASFDD